MQGTAASGHSYNTFGIIGLGINSVWTRLLCESMEISDPVRYWIKGKDLVRIRLHWWPGEFCQVHVQAVCCLCLCIRREGKKGRSPPPYHHRLPGSKEGWHVLSFVTKTEDVKDIDCRIMWVGDITIIILTANVGRG